MSRLLPAAAAPRAGIRATIGATLRAAPRG
jgi:hypothetical protein